MRCKKHVPDLTSTVGVCASCLRERLDAVLAAQAKAQAQTARFVPKTGAQLSAEEDDNQLKKAEPNTPPLNITDSVLLPHVSHRKSDIAGWKEIDRLFYRTPQQVGLTGYDDGRTTLPSKRRIGRFWNLSSLFRTRSNKPQTPHRPSCNPSAAATASPAWLATNLPPSRKNHDDNNNNGSPYRKSDRETDESGNVFDGNDRWISAESSPKRKNQAAATMAPARRSRFGPTGKSVAKLALCLSPLVRASPNRQWNNKGLAQELGAPVGGAHQHMPTAAASFSANRSRKFADFGRVNHNR